MDRCGMAGNQQIAWKSKSLSLSILVLTLGRTENSRYFQNMQLKEITILDALQCNVQLYYQSQSQRSPSSEWIFDVITRCGAVDFSAQSVLEGPVDVLQGGWRVHVLVDGVANDVSVDGVGVTATAVGLHVVVVNDGGVGQQGRVLIQVQAVVQGLIRVQLVSAAVAAIQILLDRKLLGDEVGQVLRLDVADIQDRLIVWHELGLDQGTVRRVQLIVQRGHQVLSADHLLDFVPIPVQVEPGRFEDLLRQSGLL